MYLYQLISNKFGGDLLIGFIILIGVILIVREIVTWYWKINKIVELLETQNNLLRAHLNGDNPKIEK